MKKLTIVAAQILLPILTFASGNATDPLDQWPQWRGPLATGVAPRADPPVEWSEDRNVRWKRALPGTGH